MTFDIELEEWQEGCFKSVLLSANDIEGLSFDIEGKIYDIVPDIVTRYRIIARRASLYGDTISKIFLGYRRGPDIAPDIVIIVYINLTCHLEHAGPSLQRHGILVKIH